MLSDTKKERILLLAAVFLLAIVQESWADAGQGICQYDEGATCAGFGGSVCTSVPGCSYGTIGTCEETTTGQCQYPCSDGGMCSYCDGKTDYFSCVNTNCNGVYGCRWNGNACQGVPICSQINNANTCTLAGCRWVSTQTCSLQQNAPCIPGAQPPNCCASPYACINDGGGSHKCLQCIPQGSQSHCSSTGTGMPKCCIGLVCNPETNLCEPCRQLGNICQTSSDCCSHICENGICAACSSQGGPCGSNSDCCAGLVCNPSTRACSVPDCKREGESCATGNCCQPPKVPKPLYCDSQNRNPPTCRYCAQEGENCGPNLKCCSPLACSSGKCRGEEGAGICGSSNFNNIFGLAAVAAFATAAVVALIYMAGEFFQNPKMITWSKIEAMQLFVSIAAISAIFFVLFSFCSMNVKEIGEFSGIMPYIFKNQPNLNIYQAAQLYLEHLMGVGIRNMASVRFNLGAYELRTAFTTYECDSVCWLSLASTNVGKYAGETVQLGITNNLLGTATVSYLTSAFQYFTLQYILNGLFLSFLPVALVIRALPFMRQFGGALVGIIVALYILYPMMLVFSAVVAPYLAKSSPSVLYDRDRTMCAGIDIYRDSVGNEALACVRTNLPGQSNYEWELGGYGISRSDRGIGEENLPHPGEFWAVLKANVLIFVTSVFLPAINFIVIAALARDLSRFLGEEADISRLGQMI